MAFKESFDELAVSPLRFAASLQFPDPGKIRVYDVTLRDGEQMAGVALSPASKYEILRAMSDLGVHVAEIGFPVVAESERQFTKLAVEGKRRGEIREEMELVVVSRCSRADVDATLESLNQIGVRPDEVTVATFTSASDLHLKYKLGRTLLRFGAEDDARLLETPLSFFRQANIELFQDTIRYARGRGIPRVQVVAEDVTRADPDYAVALFAAGIEAGGFRPGICDTVGVATPESIAFYARKLVQGLPDQPMYSHFHNDLGLAAINTIVATAQGMEYFSGSLNGLGERAGNAPIHQIVAILRWLYGVEIPGFKYEKLREVAHLVERLTGIPTCVHEPVIGANVFTHESGIHTAGVLVDPRIYEVIPPTAVGGDTSYLFGKHSGNHVVQHALEKKADQLRQRDIHITIDLVARVTDEIKRLREEQAETDHAERIVDEVTTSVGRLGLTEDDVLRVALQIAEG